MAFLSMIVPLAFRALVGDMGYVLLGGSKVESVSANLITLLEYLLPGFITAWIFYSLTSFVKPSQFERVVQALIFTFIIQFFVQVFQYLFIWWNIDFILENWESSVKLISSSLISLFLGVGFSYFTNNDKFHKLLRKLNITRETSYPSEWFSAFLQNITYVVLHLKDGRRVYGWPIEWPSEPGKGHFLLTDVFWLDKLNKMIKMAGTKYFLIDVNEILWVEFLEKEQENIVNE